MSISYLYIILSISYYLYHIYIYIYILRLYNTYYYIIYTYDAIPCHLSYESRPVTPWGPGVAWI